MKEKICSFNPEDERTVGKADAASGNGQAQSQWGRSASAWKYFPALWSSCAQGRLSSPPETEAIDTLTPSLGE